MRTLVRGGSWGESSWLAGGVGGGGGAVAGGARRRSRRSVVSLAVVLAAAVVVASCSNSAGDPPPRAGVTVPTGPGSSTTTTSSPVSAPIDITTKPATITVEYADAVMDELDRILSDAIRDFVAADGPTKSFDDKLNAVYDEPSLENARSAYGKFAIDGADEFRVPPGDVTTTVKEILKSEAGCVVLFVRRDFGPVFRTPRADARETGYIAFEPTDADGDHSRLNPTPWSIVFDGNVLDGEDPRNAC